MVPSFLQKNTLLKLKPIHTLMNDKYRFRLATLVLLGFLLLLLLAGIFKTSHDLRISARLLKSAVEKTNESSAIVQHQDSLIRELWKMNEKLSEQIRQLDSANRIVRRELDLGFRNANRQISTMRETLDKISIPQIR